MKIQSVKSAFFAWKPSNAATRGSTAARMLPGHAGYIVRDLYRRILTVARDYPTGLDAVRAKAKVEFTKNAHLDDGLELRKAVSYGRYMVREMQGVVKLKKYRAMKQRYVDLEHQRQPHDR